MDDSALKYCKICGITKNMSDFYKEKRKKDGLMGHCKTCQRAYQQQWIQKNPEKALEISKALKDRRMELTGQWRERNRKKLKEDNREYYLRVKKEHNEQGRAYYHNHPDKIAAHRAVTRAIKLGELIRQPCRECGKERVDAHHDDYSKPLDVIWLCRRHHKLRHVELDRNSANSENIRKI